MTGYSFTGKSLRAHMLSAKNPQHVLIIAGLLVFYILHMLVYIGLTAKIEQQSGDMDQGKLLILADFIQRNTAYGKYFSIVLVYLYAYYYQKGIFRNYLVNGLSRKELYVHQLMLVAITAFILPAIILLLMLCTGHLFSLDLASALPGKSFAIMYCGQVIYFVLLGVLSLFTATLVRSYLGVFVLYVYYQAEQVMVMQNAEKWNIRLLEYLPVSTFSQLLRPEISILQMLALAVWGSSFLLAGHFLLKKHQFLS